MIARIIMTVVLLLIAAAFVPLRQSSTAQNGIYRVQHEANGLTLTLEFQDDDLLHFEYSDRSSNAISTSPMVFKTDYAGPSQIDTLSEGMYETPELRVVIAAESLCFTVEDKLRDTLLTTLCPTEHGLSLDPGVMQNVYGLGEQFITPGQPDGDWVGQKRTPGIVSGNAIVSFAGGNVENAQFPILYALGEAYQNYALFLDQPEPQIWDFTGDPWWVALPAETLRGYIMTGADLPDLRGDYMELVGHPPVPPKQMFGLWISEYGFESWFELLDTFQTLYESGFPIDGFVLDLQWYGGINEQQPERSRIGSLTFDPENFPDAEEFIGGMRLVYGLSLMTIEQPYVSRYIPEFDMLAEQGYLVENGCPDCDPVLMGTWWGEGGMLDFSDDTAMDFWHDEKRQPLIEAGIMGHWTDLGEPENFHPDGWYAGWGNQHSDTANHNLYNLYWAESIARGYERNQVDQRPFILSRSGTSGIQRFGTAMWSADIGANLPSLGAHLNTQMHMSLSGVDYFGADIGGFWHWEADPNFDPGTVYTVWFAHGMLLDVPGRPHTFNVENEFETAPDRIGDVAANLHHARLRYSLSPYLYSLAHRAYLYAEPVYPPLVYYYQDDPNVREMGSQKLIGRDLMVVTATDVSRTTIEETEAGIQYYLDVYLPAGTWFDYDTNEWYSSAGEWIENVPLLQDGIFRLPIFVRGGALIPQMYVDEQTVNVLGRRRDGTRRDELIIRAYADGTPGEFTLYEDDNITTAYQNGEVRTTRITLSESLPGYQVIVHPAEGDFDGASNERENMVIYLITNGTPITSVQLNGIDLPQRNSMETFENTSSGWILVDENTVIAKSGRVRVEDEKVFIFNIEE